MRADHCRDRCQLFAQREGNRVPREGVFAYSLFRRLTSPAVERFALQADIFDALNVRLSSAGTLELVAHLDALMEGVEEARRELDKEKGSASARRR